MPGAPTIKANLDAPGVVSTGANQATGVTQGNASTTANTTTTVTQAGDIKSMVGAVQAGDLVAAAPSNTQATAATQTRVGSCRTTAAAGVTADTIAVPVGSVVILQITAVGREQAGANVGNLVVLVQNVGYENTGAGAVAAGVQGALGTTPHDAALATCTLGFSVAGANVSIQPTGVAATTIDWTVYTNVRTV
jgi:hypothetical protein